MEKNFIGREEEQKLLKEYIDSDNSEFIAVYGRRRVGKTCLIQQVVGDRFAFYAAGMNDVPLRMQLANFMRCIREKCPKVRQPKTWLEAFIALETYLESLPAGHKIVFIDEMPWMDTPRSNFISGLEHFWNSWASWRDDIKLIVCGSATSWLINKLIRNRGGLHNRVTHQISLKPFTLKECREYFKARGFRFSNKDVAECYMAFGGVPFYLSKFVKGDSLAQNIDRLLFAQDGELRDEFQSLYRSLYKNAENHIKIVTALASKGKGMTRRELIDRTGLPDNGKFTMMLSELEMCGFVRSYRIYLLCDEKMRPRPAAKLQTRNVLFQLKDPFTLFHFQIMRKTGGADPNFWSNNQNTPLHSTWSGFSFEMLCLNHEEQIRTALGISGMTTTVYSWTGGNGKRAAQIDMLIDRSDRTINLCEMKYHKGPYSMTAKDEEDIERKIAVFREATDTDKNIIVTMITLKGLDRNEHSGCVQKEIILDQLFC